MLKTILAIIISVTFFGVLFFILVAIAAWSSAISLLEPAVAWLMEARHVGRITANVILASFAWMLGLGTVFSFNIAADMTVAGFTFFDALDFLTANIMLPLGGLGIALFVGFVMKRELVIGQMSEMNSTAMGMWRLALCYLAPVAIASIFLMGIYDKFFFS